MKMSLLTCLKCEKEVSAGQEWPSLECGHYLCSECSEESEKCPVCLRTAVVRSTRSSTIPDCGGCFAKPAAVYCATCCCLHCLECDAFFHSKVFTEHHSRFPVCESHKSLPVKLKCDSHVKPLRFFCVECQMRVCEDCVTADYLRFRTTGRKGGGIDGGEHVGHDYHSLKDEFDIALHPKIERNLLKSLAEQMRITTLLLESVSVREYKLQEEEQKATTALHSNMQNIRNGKRLKADSKTEMSDCQTQEKSDDAEKQNLVPAVAAIDHEFDRLYTILHERKLLLIQDVQVISRDKLVKLHHQGHILHEIHAVLYLLRRDLKRKCQIYQKLLNQLDEKSAVDGYSDANFEQMASLLDKTIRCVCKSEGASFIDILDEVGHLPSANLPLHFSELVHSAIVSFGIVDGPSPPEHLRCCFAKHDSFSQAITLSWTAAEELYKKRRRDARQSLKKHDKYRETALFDPYEDIDENNDTCDENVDLDVSCEESEHLKSTLQNKNRELSHEEMMNLVYSMDTTKIGDLERLESEIVKAAERPLQKADVHVVEMRVLKNKTSNDYKEETLSRLVSKYSHTYDPQTIDEDFVEIAVVSSHHSKINIDISNYPSSCLQFRIYARTSEGVKGDHSVVLTFDTPNIYSYECEYKKESGPFDANSGLLYLLGTGLGLHQYQNPLLHKTVGVTASNLLSGNLSSFVSEGHDGDVVVAKRERSLLPFLQCHDDISQGNAWIEMDISSGCEEKNCELLLIPSHYSLRSASGDGGKPRSWVLQACRVKPQHGNESTACKTDTNDEAKWVILREHKHDKSLSPNHLSSATWSLEECSLVGDNLVSDKPRYHAYRYFRIVSTGANSSGNSCLECSGFELYGRLVLVSRQLDSSTQQK